MQVLYDAVAGHEWSRSAIESVHIDIKTFEAFYARLANSLQKQLRLETVTGSTSRHGSFSNPSSQGIFFNQGRYTNPKSQPTGPRNFPGDFFFTSRFSGKCFNCGTPGHRAKQCKKPTDWRRAKANEAVWLNRQNGKPADDAYGVKVVFCEMADALNDVFSAKTEDAYLSQAEDDAQALFSSLSISDAHDESTRAVRFNEKDTTQSEGEQATADINLFTALEEAAEHAASNRQQSDQSWEDIYFLETGQSVPSIASNAPGPTHHCGCWAQHDEDDALENVDLNDGASSDGDRLLSWPDATRENTAQPDIAADNVQINAAARSQDSPNEVVVALSRLLLFGARILLDKQGQPWAYFFDPDTVPAASTIFHGGVYTRARPCQRASYQAAACSPPPTSFDGSGTHLPARCGGKRTK